jgi:zinc and cadmium transporter
MTLAGYISIFFGAILSGCVVLAVPVSQRILKLVLSFSGAFLFALTISHILPELYPSDWKTGAFIIGGFLIQVVLEFFSEGIEHGHVHQHEKHEHNFPVTMMIALALHAFLEGMPLYKDFGSGKDTHEFLFYGILLHNVPISIALVSMLLHSGLKKGKVIFWLVLFACMTPLGSLFSGQLSQILSAEGTAGLVDNLTALVVGIFLHISTTILFESSENHRFNLVKFIIILLGASAGLLL